MGSFDLPSDLIGDNHHSMHQVDGRQLSPTKKMAGVLVSAALRGQVSLPVVYVCYACASFWLS